MLNFNILHAITILDIVSNYLPYAIIFVIAISFLLSLKLFEHHIFRYKLLLKIFYLFLILLIINTFINYLLPYNFWGIYIFLVIYIFLLYYIKDVTKKYGLLPVEVIVFINLFAFGIVLYSILPIAFALTFLSLLKEFYVFWLLFVVGLLFYLINIMNTLKLGINKNEILHIVWALFIYIIITLYSFYIGQGLYFNIYKFFLVSVLFAGIIEFISNFPTISKAPQYKGFKKWFWLLIFIVFVTLLFY